MQFSHQLSYIKPTITLHIPRCFPKHSAQSLQKHHDGACACKFQ